MIPIVGEIGIEIITITVARKHIGNKVSQTSRIAMEKINSQSSKSSVHMIGLLKT